MSEHKDGVLQIRVPVSLLERIDEAKGEDVPRSRWVRRVLEAALVPEGARASRKSSGEDMAGVDVSRATVRVPKSLARQTKVSAPQSARHSDTQRDANEAYTRMMAERQARMNRGS